MGETAEAKEYQVRRCGGAWGLLRAGRGGIIAAWVGSWMGAVGGGAVSAAAQDCNPTLTIKPTHPPTPSTHPPTHQIKH